MTTSADFQQALDIIWIARLHFCCARLGLPCISYGVNFSGFWGDSGTWAAPIPPCGCCAGRCCERGSMSVVLLCAVLLYCCTLICLCAFDVCLRAGLPCVCWQPPGSALLYLRRVPKMCK
jgi:hypothetical protein